MIIDLWLVFAILVGLAVGSFLNVCIYRLPKGQSIVSPPSRCPACGKNLSAPDLIPVIGYIFLLGRCRHCGNKISVRYPLVELFTSAVFALLYLKCSFSPDFAFYAIFCSLLVVISAIDIDTMEIPDVLVWIGTASGFTFSLLKGDAGNSVIGAALGFCLVYMIIKAARRILGREAMGEGDAMLTMMVGSTVGGLGVLLSLYFAFLIGGFVAVLMLLLRRRKIGEEVPFGPMIAAGALVFLFLGKGVIDWYLKGALTPF